LEAVGTPKVSICIDGEGEIDEKGRDDSAVRGERREEKKIDGDFTRSSLNFNGSFPRSIRDTREPT
jgi:hypothetical protein